MALYFPKINRFYAAISPRSKIGQLFQEKPKQIGKELLAKKEKLKSYSKNFQFCRSIAP
jgi:hypothetical protein